MGLLILRVSIVDVIGGHQSNLRLLCHPKQRLVHQFLFLDPVVLQFQEEISFPEYLLVS